MTLEASTTISDSVTAELIDCSPVEPTTEPTMVLVDVPDASPVERAAEATIEQTGAGPPPDWDMR